MSNGLNMFPDSFDEFIDQYKTKEPKFGDYYISALKVRQALEHYAAKAQSTGITLDAALDADPYAVLATAIREIAANVVNCTIQSSYEAANNTLRGVEQIVNDAVTNPNTEELKIM